MRRDSRARILVVEDEPELAAEVDQTLVELGYDVVGRAARSDEAIERTEERKPDLLLMDIRLRGKRDGIETAAEIRDRFRLPVVFMSAHTDEATLGRARRSSPYGYVVKPFTLGELWTAIEIALERHALETKLREGERWFQTTLRSIGDAILCTDVEGAVTFMNQRAEKLLGWRFDDVANRQAADVFQVIEERSRSAVTLPLGAVLRGEPTPAVPDGLLLVDRTGGGIPIDASVAPICDEDKVLGAVVVFRDLSDRRVLQRRLEFADRLAALGTMAAGIAHEVNNPLAVIMANLAMLAEAQSRGTPQPLPPVAAATTPTMMVQSGPPRSWLDNATVREILADAVTAADRVRRIVADLRSFTQADDVGEGPVDVERALKWALQSTAREFRHRARVVTQFGQLPLLGGSEVRLGQVFVNLLVNAAHSISPGQVNTNEVRVNARTDERGWVVVEISDTGSGIPHEIRGQDLRSLLHHEADRHGQRPGAVGVSRHREVVRRRDPGRERARARQCVPRALAARCFGLRAERDARAHHGRGAAPAHPGDRRRAAGETGHRAIARARARHRVGGVGGRGTGHPGTRRALRSDPV